jgi:hypothetical protein
LLDFEGDFLGPALLIMDDMQFDSIDVRNLGQIM